MEAARSRATERDAFRPAVPPFQRGEVAGIERLAADADPVDAPRGQRLGQLGCDRLRVGLHAELDRGRQGQIVQGRQDPAPGGVRQGGSACRPR